ncbi:MAG: NYN domain-containing protein [Clostridia bacterium]|nr:NYN domain-containing protein [Clostridia bacterium]
MIENNLHKRLAVLIDADNASPKIITGLLEEVATYGIASVKRIYGNWTSPSLGSWKEVLLKYAIQPIQQFDYTVGKNATDSAMIIDAMDLLYTGKLDGFCIVSSDSDFTKLASRIREEGLMVYGFGEKKTPKAFVGACDKFVYTEILRENSSNFKQNRMTKKQLLADKQLLDILFNAVEDAANENGWSHLGTVGQTIANKSPEFDPRNYGFKKLGELIKYLGLFTIDERSNDNSPAKAVYIRRLKNKA